MKKLDNILLALGLLFYAYAIFSRFYGEPSIALKCIHSKSLLIMGNGLFLLSIIASIRALCKKS